MRERRTERGGTLLWMMALVILVGVIGAGLLNLFRSYQTAILDSQKNQLINISESVANNIEVYLGGFQSAAETLAELSPFARAEEAYGRGSREEMAGLLEEYLAGRAGEVAGVCYADASGEHCFAGKGEHFALKKAMGSSETFQQTDILTDEEGEFYFGISARTKGGGLLTIFVPVRRVYEKTASPIRMGSNGYVMIKDSDGLILMHPVEAQIGIDVLADRKVMYPQFDYSELEELIAHQLAGESGVEIYHSYWWANDPPTSVQKVSAYLPVYLGEDFLSISAVMDYAEIAGPVQNVGARILLLTVVMVITLIILLLLIRQQFQVLRENVRLKRINEELEKLHEQEEQLAQQQRLQLIGTMTSGIAHEFNNLLTPIMGYSAMMLGDMTEEDENYEDMREILESAEKAKEIIDQITQFSRKNAEKMFAPIHVGEVVKKALVIIEAAKPRNVQMESRIESEHDICLASPVQIHQMILNLGNNAVAAIGSEPGTLTIVGEAMQPVGNRDAFFRGKEKKWFYRISVTDTGCGMSEEVQQQIFVPFFTTKKPGEGTGLGLAIVQRLVEAHGGYICVHSREGKGTTFVIYLPILDGEDIETEPGR